MFSLISKFFLIALLVLIQLENNDTFDTDYDKIRQDIAYGRKNVDSQWTELKQKLQNLPDSNCNNKKWGKNCNIDCNCGDCMKWIGVCDGGCTELDYTQGMINRHDFVASVCSLHVINYKVSVERVVFLTHPKKGKSLPNLMNTTFFKPPKDKSKIIPKSCDEWALLGYHPHILIVLTKKVRIDVIHIKSYRRSVDIKIFVGGKGPFYQKKSNLYKLAYSKSRLYAKEKLFVINLYKNNFGERIAIEASDSFVWFVYYVLLSQCIDGTYGDRCLLPCGMCNATVGKCNRDGTCLNDECATGYGGKYCNASCSSLGKYGDDCKKDCGVGCMDGVCDPMDGKCKCKVGYQSGKCQKLCDKNKWGQDCTQPCGQCYQNATCDAVRGRCDAGCDPGFTGDACITICEDGKYGKDCRYSCHECGDITPCDKVSGHCVPRNFCKPGYIGDKCDKSCPFQTFGLKCQYHCHCFGEFTCNIITGDCGSHGCKGNWYSSQCNVSRACPLNQYGAKCIDCGICRVKCNSSDVCLGHCNHQGVCTLGCMARFMGERCDRCRIGWYGRNCDKESGYCQYGGVPHGITGICTSRSCDPGYLGSRCIQECKKGLWGEHCELRCSLHCKETCSFIFGTCSICDHGWTGELCSHRKYCKQVGKWGDKCQLDCFHCRLGKKCAQYGGHCPHGCEIGYYHSNCDEECPDGYYGWNCKRECGYCSEWEVCNARTGICKHGCMGMYTPPKCTVCPYIYVGFECGRTCGHCKHNEECDKLTGACAQGCLNGFSGAYCDIRTNDFDVDLDDVITEWSIKEEAKKLPDEGE